MAVMLATVPELLTRVGVVSADISQEDTQRAEAALADASALVLEEADQTWASPAETPATVRTVVLAVARRVFTNPEGFTSETTGPFTVRRETTGLFLTEDEAKVVRRYRPQSKQPSGLWTQPTYRDTPREVGYVMDQYGTEPIPYYPGEDW